MVQSVKSLPARWEIVVPEIFSPLNVSPLQLLTGMQFPCRGSSHFLLNEPLLSHLATITSGPVCMLFKGIL